MNKETFDKILNLANELSGFTASNLSDIVKIQSLSTGEKNVCLEIKNKLLQAGFDEVFIDPLGNVIARIGSGKKILAFDAHIDTVAPGNLENWNLPPFSGLIENGFVHGRGTVDQKGGAAAMITAGKILKSLNLNNDLTIYFTFTVMEEDCDGLCWKYIIEENKIKPDFVVITEPTNCSIYRGHRGRMEINIEFNGISSHGSAPERGINAIYLASKTCLALERLNENLTSDDFLGKGSVTVSEFISSSPSLCAVSDYAKFHLDRRLTWGETKESAVKEIETLLSQNINPVSPAESIPVPPPPKVSVLQYKTKAYTGIEYGMEKYYPTWKLEENHPFVQTALDSYKQLFNKEPLIDKWTFSTNAVVTNGIYKIPTIGFGPGNEILAHAPNEKIPVNDLVIASAFYAAIALNIKI